MQIGNLNASNFFFAMLIVWGLVALYNRQSLVMLSSLVIYELLQAITVTNFHAFLVASSIYFFLSQSNIKYLSVFRKAFTCFGVVYFLGAIDQAVYYHFEFDTYFDRIQPYLVTTVNAYVLTLLIGGGGRQDAGFADYISATFNRWLTRLSLHQESNQHLSNRETK